MLRALGALAVVALTCLPVGASAASGPNPETLRATLADLTDTTWTEAEVGAAATLAGPLDINYFQNYYETFGQDPTWIQFRLRILEKNGFVGGYGRQWYRPRTHDSTWELVLVFNTASGASSFINGDKILDAQEPSFQSYFDPQLNPGAYGITMSATDYHFVAVTFGKGNAVFAVDRWSEKETKTDDVVAQARKMYAQAPSSIPVPGQANSWFAFPQNYLLFIIAGLWLLLVAATVVAVVAIVVFAPRRRVTHPSMPPPPTP